MLLEVGGQLVVRAYELAHSRKLKEILSEASNRVMHCCQLLAILLCFGGVLLLRAGVRSHLLLLLLHLGRQVSKGGITVESNLGLGAWCASSLHHESTNLLLKRIILFFKLVVLFLYP